MRTRRAIAIGVAAAALVTAGFWFLGRGPAISASPEARPDGGTGVAAASPASSVGARAPVAPAPSPRVDPTRILPRVRSAIAQDLPNGAFSGRVVSADTGAGLERAEVTFSGPNGAVSIATDATGAFEFTPSASGTYQVAAVQAEGFLPFGPEWGKSPIVLTATAGVRVSDLVIALTPAPELTGKVLEPGGRPVPGAEVRVLMARASESVLFPFPDHFTSDARGEFRFHAPAGAIAQAHHATLGRGRATVDAEALAAKKVAITLAHPEESHAARAEVSGQVIAPDGSPAVGAVVSARSASSAWPTQYGERDGYESVTDEAGRFVLSGLEAGVYDVTALSAGDAPARLFDVKVPAGELVLRLGAGGKLTGRVVDDRGLPVPAFDAALEVLRGPLERLSYAQSRFVNADGRFEFAAVAPGRYVLEVVSTGFVPSEVPIEFPEGKSELQATVRLEPGGKVTGRVVTAATNQPISGARVSVEGRFTTGSLSPSFSALTDQNGEFAIEGVPVGGVTLFVSATGHNSRVFPGAKPAVPVTIELSAREADAGQKIELVGIGAVLAARNDALVLGTVVPGGGAAEAGLAPGDGIVSIDGTPVIEIGFTGAISRIRGPEGTTVTLGIRRAGKSDVVDVTVTRKKISA